MEPKKRKSWQVWAQRLGVVGFLFFFAKGLVWIALAAGVYMAAR